MARNELPAEEPEVEQIGLSELDPYSFTDMTGILTIQRRRDCCRCRRGGRLCWHLCGFDHCRTKQRNLHCYTVAMSSSEMEGFALL